MNKNMLFILLLSLTSVPGYSSIERVTKWVEVKIISGTYTSEVGCAEVSYDPSLVSNKGLEKIKDGSIRFRFLNQTVTGTPEVELVNGEFKDVLWVTSMKSKNGESFNFGFNTGFERYQFSRRNEGLIRDGKSYFGYLFPNTYVDGAGMINYSKTSCF